MQFEGTTNLYRKSGFGLHQLRNRCSDAKGLETAVGHSGLVLVIL